jgi:hypothetical protein
VIDLSLLSDQDLAHLQAGNLSSMSDAGFAQFVKAREAATPMADKVERTRQQMADQMNPTRDMGGAQRFAAGAGKAVVDIGRAVKQVLGGMTRQDVDATQALDAPLMKTPEGKLGFVAGTGAASVPLAMLPGAATLTGALGYGAASGALTPVGTNDDVLRNTLGGAAGGAAGWAATKGAAKAISPAIDPQARALTSEGVALTPGQQLGGTFKRIEEGMTSLPVTGDAIRNAQRRSVESFNAAVADRALAPIGNKLPSGLAGRDAVDYVENAIGSVYDSALKRLKAIKADTTFDTEMVQLRNMLNQSPMPDPVKRQFENVIRQQVAGKLQGQRAMTAETWKQADSELGRYAAKYQGDASADMQLLGDALQEAQAAMRRWLQRAAPADVSSDLSAANQAWAEFKRMQRAAGSQASQEGVFSPEQYRAAVRAMDKSKDRGAFARGDALGQDLADAGVSVIGRSVPDSGTPFRTLVSNPLTGLFSVAATAPVAAAYASPTALRAAQSLISGKRPALATKLAAELEMLSPAAIAGGISAANAMQRSGPR